MITAPADLVNLEQYPVASLDTVAGKAFADQCRQQFKDNGLCILPNFILPQGLELLAQQANAVRDQAYFCKNKHNAYLTEDDDSLADGDVARRQEYTYVGSVAYDRIGEDSWLKKLYQWDPLKDFIAHVLKKEHFYRQADVLGACSINVFVDGGEHGWHFDESEYTVTLMLQRPDQGGKFEYAPQIRGREDEKKIIHRILNGEREGVEELPFSAGTLLIFGGKQTLHRVTKVTGDKARLVPVLCYAETPGLINSDSVRKLFWGRVGSESETAA